MQDVAGTRIVHRGEGAYPKPCDFCRHGVSSNEVFVILEDGRVLHETCAFLLNDELNLE